MPHAKSPMDILTWWPNIIGYARIVLALISFYLYERPYVFTFCYCTSFFLDAADGHVARIMDQCSRFGAVLDMVTDRFATAILVLILSHLYFDFRFSCMLLIILDFCSHWLRMYSTLLQGGESHKKVVGGPGLLHLYYNNRIVLGLVCLGNELFYVFLYMQYYFPVVTLPFIGEEIALFHLLVILCAPVFLLKQVINVIQMWNSAIVICEWEYEQLEGTSSRK